MKSGYFIGLAIVAFIVSIVYYSLQGGQTPEDYTKEIQQEREARDEVMRSSKDSPFAGSKEPFTGLHYYSPDPQYKVLARWIPVENKKMRLIPSSDNTRREYLEHGFAEFELAGSVHRLMVLEVTDAGPLRGTLFLAFADETSARETYGAGRYLDIKNVPGSSHVTLDFNLAYNPYCAYADRFSCPFPPPENVLKIAIRAGEKVYH